MIFQSKWRTRYHWLFYYYVQDVAWLTIWHRHDSASSYGADKISVYDKILNENQQIQLNTIFYMNFHLKDDPEVDFVACKKDCWHHLHLFYEVHLRGWQSVIAITYYTTQRIFNTNW